MASLYYYLQDMVSLSYYLIQRAYFAPLIRKAKNIIPDTPMSPTVLVSHILTGRKLTPKKFIPVGCSIYIHELVEGKFCSTI